MYLSCCVWSLPGAENDNLSQIARLGFHSIDIQLAMLSVEATRAQARELGLPVACVGASFGLPKGATFDSPDKAATAQALAHFERAVAHGAELGASAAYVVPGLDNSPQALARYAEAMFAAADIAAGLGLKLAIEHFPGRALPTVAGTLDFIKKVGHPNLYLLFDIGHAQISGENPAAAIKTAGERLGYVHLDDNDGQGDLHWALLDGVMSEESLRQAFEALVEVGYHGPVSLELNQTLPDPLNVLQRSREVALRMGEKKIKN